MLNKIQCDYIIAIAVFIQSLLVIVQAIMIDVFGMPEESTTIYRIILTILPLGIAILLSFRREPIRWIIVYMIVLSILAVHLLLFPANEVYIRSEGLRFLLPMVIPSALCLISVNNIYIIERAVYVVSWATSILILFYALNFFLGKFALIGYNMSFSYGALIPMVSLYSHKGYINTIMSLFLFLIVLAIGSRGAAIVFMLYILYDAFVIHRKRLLILLGILFSVVTLIPLLVDAIESIGLSSRTLELLLSNDIISHDSGRGDIQAVLLNELKRKPLFGIGLYGDRVFLNGSYCHNIFFEWLLNFGFLIGGILLVLFLAVIIITYYRSDKKERMFFVKYFLVLFVPLLVSNSYLSSYNFGILIGLICVLNSKNRKILQPS